ncbi:MAG: cytochrome c [Gemmatimonadota bacterium]
MRKAGVLLAAAFVVFTGCSPMDDALVAVFGRSMRDQPSFDPYENPRMPAEGSVPFAAGNYPSDAGSINTGQPGMMASPPPAFTQLQVLQQADVVTNLQNPVPATAESLARGEEMYLRTCAPCHGPDGSGATGYVVPAGFPPFPLTADNVVAYPDGYLYGIIRVGRGLMPAYGHQVTNFDRWHIVNYVRQLQQGASAGGAGGAASDDSDSD